MLRMLSGPLFIVLILLTSSLVAQDNAANRVKKREQGIQRAAAVEKFAELLEHDDLQTSMAALDGLLGLRKSRDRFVRDSANAAVQKFHENAWDWLEANAKIRNPKVQRPRSWDDRNKQKLAVAFLESDIDPARLVYLRVIRVDMLAFVKMPQITDKHLACLRDQPKLISLTLERTGVEGNGFIDSDIPSVQVIFMTGSPFKNKGLIALNAERFPDLVNLIVTETEVTEAGIEEFRKANPAITDVRQ